MSDTVCPQCREKCSNSVSCDFCGIVFAEYESRKQESIGRVYQLISTGDLEQARETAEKLPMQFPDSKGDFLLLLSNINRDISIVERYQQALESFERGDCSEAVLLLRNIKAFDKGLDEKVISLRRKAERCGRHDSDFQAAVEQFDAGRFAEARALLETISGYKEQEKVNSYLQQIYEVKDELLRSAVECLKQNQFDSAGIEFEKLHTVFPDAEQETRGYMAILSAKKEIWETLLAAARKAREDERFIEARVIYSYLGWQYPDSLSILAPYIDEIGSPAATSLTDFGRDNSIDFAALGLQLDSYGFFVSAPERRQAGGTEQGSEGTPAGAPVSISPVPSADHGSKPVDLSGEEVADFTC
jgi:tetratricopeptide (TPR) repeat protein